MKKLIVYHIDSFTKEKFKGNPAGVVVNADGLSYKEMLLIARELNNRETAFLFSPDTNDCDGIIRYFTPTKEVPLCGHATIAAMYAKALEEKLDSCILNIKTKVGILPFEVIKENNDYKIEMTQGKIEISNTIDKKYSDTLVKALGLHNEDLDIRCPIQIASTGNPMTMIGIKQRDKLNNLNADLDQLLELSRQIKCNGFFIFTFDSYENDILTYGRMFAPIISLNEDPVTGTANGPLGAYLIHNRLIDFKENIFKFKGKQGEAIDRPGVVNVIVEIERNVPILVKIKGEAVVIFKTEILI